MRRASAHARCRCKVDNCLSGYEIFKNSNHTFWSRNSNKDDHRVSGTLNYFKKEISSNSNLPNNPWMFYVSRCLAYSSTTLEFISLMTYLPSLLSACVAANAMAECNLLREIVKINCIFCGSRQFHTQTRHQGHFCMCCSKKR